MSETVSSGATRAATVKHDPRQFYKIPMSKFHTRAATHPSRITIAA